MDSLKIQIAYKKFNTFLSDYIRMFSKKYYFMKVATKYDLEKKIDLQISVSGLNVQFILPGMVSYIGNNELNESGIGLKFNSQDIEKSRIKSIIIDECNARYGSHWTSEISKLFSNGDIK